jgi:hypothetical protein
VNTNDLGTTVTSTETIHSTSHTLWSTVPPQYHWIIVILLFCASHYKNIWAAMQAVYVAWGNIGGIRGLATWAWGGFKTSEKSVDTTQQKA